MIMLNDPDTIGHMYYFKKYFKIIQNDQNGKIHGDKYFKRSRGGAGWDFFLR